MGSPVFPTPLGVWRSTGQGSGEQFVMTFGLQQILLWLAVSWDSLVPYAGLQAAAEGKLYNTNLNRIMNPSATSRLSGGFRNLERGSAAESLGCVEWRSTNTSWHISVHQT